MLKAQSLLIHPAFQMQIVLSKLHSRVSGFISGINLSISNSSYSNGVLASFVRNSLFVNEWLGSKCLNTFKLSGIKGVNTGGGGGGGVWELQSPQILRLLKQTHWLHLLTAEHLFSHVCEAQTPVQPRL